jgi:cell division protein FtsB
MPSDPIGEIKTVITVVILVALMGIICYLAYTKSLLETKVAQQETDITALTDQNTNFKTQVEASNAAIKKMHDDGVARATAAAQSIAAANRQADAFEATAKRLVAASPVGDDCTATKAFLKSYLGGKP